MDGEAHRRARALLQPIFMPDVVNTWRDSKMDPIVRNEYLKPLVPQHKADLMDFGLHFPIRLIYALIGFPMISRKRSSSTPPGRWPSWLVRRSIRRKRPWPARLRWKRPSAFTTR
jgi:cytochrome P450